MQRLSGLLVILASTGFGSYIVGPEETGRATTYINRVTQISTPATAKPFFSPGIAATPTEPVIEAAERPEISSPRRNRVFSPSAPLLAAIDDTTSTPTDARMSPSTWTAVITRTAQVEGVSSGPVRTTFSSARAGDKTARAALAADLQRELRRVGCYAGEINGGWTTSTRRAMSAFMERVNATLPFDEPDYILLSLVQGHDGIACGACPEGQQQSASGQCMPSAIVAQADHKAALQTDRLSRKKLAKANAEALHMAQANRPTDARAATEELPWLKQKPKTPTTVAAIERPEFTGRMSVGAPMATTPPHKPSLTNNNPNTWGDIEVETAATEPGPHDYKTRPQTKRTPIKSARKVKSRSNATTANHQMKSKASRKARYASGFGGKGRHGQPRAGTARYNVMLSLGGIY